MYPFWFLRSRGISEELERELPCTIAAKQLSFYIITNLIDTNLKSSFIFLFCRFYEGVVHSFDPVKKKHKARRSYPALNHLFLFYKPFSFLSVPIL